MLLGVLLALAAGTIVIFIVSQYTGGATQSEKVVVAKVTLPSSKTLAVAASGDANTIAIADAFEVKSVNTDFAPQDAYTFTTQEQLNLDLNNRVIIGQFLQGDILRKPDARLAEAGKAAAGSLTNLNPGAVAAGQVIVQLSVDNKLALVPNDRIDLLVTLCNFGGGAQSACKTQTTLQNVLVYAVRDGQIDVVLDRQKALQMKYLVESGKVTIALRKPGDTTPADTSSVSNDSIVSDFKF